MKINAFSIIIIGENMFKSMKIGAKLITGFAIVATILFGVGLYAFITLGNIKDDMDMTINNRYVKVKNTYELEILYLEWYFYAEYYPWL